MLISILQYTKYNLIPLEKAALNALKWNGNIFLTKADNDGQIVIHDKNYYVDGVKNLLNDDTYRLLSCDTSSQE